MNKPKPTTTAESQVEALAIAALNVMDEKLTDHQRHIAEQIYDLVNSLEYTFGELA